MTEAIIILLNMRGGCATVGDKVHTLFRVTSRGHCSKTVSETEENLQTPPCPRLAALTESA